MSGTRSARAALALLFGLGLQPAAADQIAASETTAGGASGTVFSTQGWSFTPAVNLLVTKLGVQDLDDNAPGLEGDGLVQSHPVGIWTAAGTLVVTATVPAGTAAALLGNGRFVDIPPTPLAAGQAYVIGAWYQGTADTLRVDGFNGSVLAFDSMIAPGVGRAGINQFTGLAFPDIVLGADRRLGPNFAFTLPAPVTRTWPSDPAPCGDINDLAACINGANHGDAIEIAADAIPAQAVDIGVVKSFALRPAPGFDPVFEGSTFFLPGGAIDATISFDALTLASGGIVAGGGSGLLDLAVRDTVFAQAAPYAGVEIYLRTGPTVLDIADNQISIGGDETYGVNIWGLEGSLDARIRGNSIVHSGGSSAGGIQVANGTGTLQVDLAGNQVAGAAFNHGISVYQYGAGSIDARLVNNTVRGQQNHAGAPGGLSLNITQGSADLEVINNTVAYNDIGILLSGQAVSALVANNIVAFNEQSGMNFDFGVEATTVNEFNLVHGNGSDEYTPGPGTLTDDPAFVSLTDLRPQSGSPAENSGSSSRVPPDITTDVAGNPRIQGIVDRGAFELAAGGSDVDADGIADPLDNCTLIANANQRDTNGDGYGNVCDADLNDSNLTTSQDYNLLRSVVNQSCAAPANTLACNADLNGSGLVTAADYNMLRSMINQPPGPSGLHP